ncbi:putative pentatricopeptide repeat-containing protein At1g53330 [Curcuma longa]|uniref:putative pentatricopeptide repeat-containing protein At1g53330 n=1 Tax=Curcuma longa TaxID=136217 RepID=UPI003D9F73D0
MLRRRPSSFKHRWGPRKPSPTRTPIPLLEELKSTADPAAALRLLQHSDPDLLTYPVCSSLLYRLVPEIDSLLALLRAHRVPCKEAAFNSLIRRFGSDGLPDRAVVDLFHALRSFEFSTSAPSVQSLNSALVGLVENRRFEQARALLAQSAAAFSLRPNAVSYNILIQGCCEAEGLSSARLLFDEMLQKGIRPTVVTYNVLIGHSAKNGDLGTGARLKEEMVRRGIQPNAIAFNREVTSHVQQSLPLLLYAQLQRSR